jgi:hypothetical protein
MVFSEEDVEKATIGKDKAKTEAHQAYDELKEEVKEKAPGLKDMIVNGVKQFAKDASEKQQKRGGPGAALFGGVNLGVTKGKYSVSKPSLRGLPASPFAGSSNPSPFGDSIWGGSQLSRSPVKKSTYRTVTHYEKYKGKIVQVKSKVKIKAKAASRTFNHTPPRLRSPIGW